MAETSDKGKAVLAQFGRLQALRQPLDQEYRECYEYTYPSLGTGFGEGVDGEGILNAAGTKTKQGRLFDSTGADAVRLLASSVLSSLTPPNTRWFELTPVARVFDDIPQDGKAWLRHCAEVLHEMIHASNYDSEALEYTLHRMIAGQAGLYIELKNGELHFETWPLNHLYCQETLGKGYIDTVYRQFFYTAQEAVIEFGLDKLPRNLQDEYKNDPQCTKLHRFVVAIRPRIKNGRQSVGTTKRNMPWESLWVAPCGTVVRESGFNEMPVIVTRWLKIPDTDYARGPVYECLPDLKSLNVVCERMLQNMDMHISGMWKVKDDGRINPATVRFGARRFIPVQDMDDIQPLHTGGDIEFALNQKATLQNNIRKMLMADQLGPTEKAIQTATEVQTRVNQTRQILGPIFARDERESLRPMIERCFSLVARANLLPEMPDSMREFVGEGLAITYRSPLARAQQSLELEQTSKWVESLTMLSQVAPELLDLVDLDTVMRKQADWRSIDPEMLNDESAVKKIRYQREQQKKAQMAQAQAAATAVAEAQQPPAEPMLPIGP